MQKGNAQLKIIPYSRIRIVISVYAAHLALRMPRAYPRLPHSHRPPLREAAAAAAAAVATAAAAAGDSRGSDSSRGGSRGSNRRGSNRGGDCDVGSAVDSVR